MRTRLLSLLFLCFLTPSLSARQNKFETVVGWRGDQLRLHTIAGKDHQFTCLFLANDDSIRAYLLGSNLELVRQFGLRRRRYEEMLGGFIRDGNICLFTKGQYDEGLHSYTINSNTGEVTKFSAPFDLKHERIIERISGGDHFLYLAYNKKTSELTAHDFTSAKNYTSLRHKVKESDFFNRSVEVEKIEADVTPGSDAAQSHNKAYLRHDTLYLLTNMARSFTKVFTFYLSDQLVLERLIPHSGYQPDEEGYTNNSFLLKDKVYFVQAAGDSLWVDVADLHTGSGLAAFKVSSEEKISFANTPLTQEGSNLSSGAERELNTKQLIRKLLNHKAFIVAAPYNGNTVEVTIGCINDVLSPVGEPRLPYTHLYRHKWLKSTGFRLLFNTTSHVHVPGKPGYPIQERVEYFVATKSLKIPPAADKLIIHNDRYHYVYYDKKERKLTIREF